MSSNPKPMPRVLLASDVRVARDQDGSWWSTHQSLSVMSLEKYLAAASVVALVARETSFDELHKPVNRLCHKRLEICALGLDGKERSLLMRAVSIIKAIARVPMGRDDLLVIRVPEIVSLFVGLRAIVKGVKVVSNVVAEPYAISGGLPKAFGASNLVYSQVCRYIVRKSSGTIYVTREVLQKQLPRTRGSASISSSNVRIEHSDFVSSRNLGPWDEDSPMRVVGVGSMESSGKGFDVLIRAMAELRNQGLDVTLDLIGDGELRGELAVLVDELYLGNTVTFHGYLNTRNELYSVLDQCHVFAMPSRHEGLPRAMIEAMARGLCVVGSKVGGIVELAAADCLFAPNDVRSLTHCLERIYLDPEGAMAFANEGRSKARDLMADARPSRTTEFLRAVSAGEI